MNGAGHYIGVGARIIANVKTNTSGINLSDLFSVAAGAKGDNSEVQGSLLFTIQGIHGKGVDTYTPKISKLDVENLTRALEAVSNIKTLLHNDKDIAITPQVLAYRVEKEQEDIVIAKDKVSGDERQAWVYLGHFDENTGEQLNIANIVIKDGFKATSIKTDDVLIAKANLTARAGYPKFPKYNLKSEIGIVPVNTQMKINNVKAVGFGKYWALVTWTEK